MSFDEIMQAPCKEELIVQLNIMNPIVADFVDYWIKIRRSRMINTAVAQRKLELL